MVETVRGPVAAEDLGTSLLHEHVFIASPEGIANHNHTWGAPWWDEEERVAAAIADLQELRDLGVRTIVDPTAFGLSRNVHRLAARQRARSTSTSSSAPACTRSSRSPRT